jgi:GDSL-like lipase/acylhydrolase family protein/SGNH-like hydrolase/esterase family protein
MNFFKASPLLLSMLLCLVTPLLAADKDSDVKLTWIDASELGLEGQGWTDTKSPYDRLPARAEGLVTPAVWGLQHNSAGICIRFETDSPEIHANWDGGKAMYHMARTGNCGLDVYIWRYGKWNFRSIGKPNETRTIKKIANAPNDVEGMTEYLVFLPLYSAVTEMKIGIVEGSTIRPSTRKRSGKPVVVYGTSITQGGCASRSGMSHLAILSRRLDKEFINLGFSGSGKMEPVIGDLLSELDADLYILEALPNMTTPMVDERIIPCVQKIREKHPRTPILLAENCNFTPSSTQNQHLKKVYDTLIEEGVINLYYLPSEKDGESMLTTCPEEGTVDGIHPTDLGFFWMANYYEPVLREILVED